LYKTLHKKRNLMKKLLLIVLGIQSFYCFGQSQEYECGAPDIDSATYENLPWTNNNDYYINFYDSLITVFSTLPESGLNAEGGIEQAVWVPVKAWVHRAGITGGLSLSEVENAIRELNRRFSGRFEGLAANRLQPHDSGIRFYLVCQPTYINNSIIHTDGIPQDVVEFMNNNSDAGNLNIHFVNTFSLGAGYSIFPWDVPSEQAGFSCLVTTSSFNYHLKSTLAHEVGHAFGLLHTHHARKPWFSNPQNNGSVNNNCYQESVSRTRTQQYCTTTGDNGALKCLVNGDKVRDTDADPLLTGLVDQNLLGEYVYTGTGKDRWNETWSPNIQNIMAYTFNEIQDYFSPCQNGIMHKYIDGTNEALGTKKYIHYDNLFVDVFEPDNTLLSAQNIQLDILQHRGLHGVPNGPEGNPAWEFCDFDWIKLDIPYNGMKLNLRTSEVPGKPLVNTEIFLYESNGLTLIASNDDKSSIDFYSEISELELPQGTYYLKVVNKGNNGGEYLLEVERCAEECCYNNLLSNVAIIDQNTGNLVIGARVSGTAEEYFGFSTNVSQATFGANIPGLTAFGSGPVALPNSQLRLAICNLSELTFQSGTLEIGDPTNGRTAEVRFTEGTKLDLDGSSQIIVKNGSKLIIEAGAELNLAAGAQIILAGSDAVLEIEGTLQLGNNQNLSIGTLSGQTPGYIRFLPGAQVLAGSGAQMVLGEVNQLRKVMELAANAHISLPANLVQFAINHGEVQMAPGSRLIVATKGVFVNARFERLGSTGLHHGVLLSGNHAHQITASRFNNAITGLEVNLMGNLHQPQLLVNQYNHNQIGLLVHGGGVLVGSGSFTGNTNWAMQLSALSAAAQVNNVTFTNNANGIKVSSANSHPITLDGCNLQTTIQSGLGVEVIQGYVTLRNSTINNYQTGVKAEGMNTRVRLACNVVSNSNFGIDPRIGALVDLSNEGRNQIENSNIALYPDFGALLLNNGYNNFSNANTHVLAGDLRPLCYTYTTISKPGSDFSFFELPAENNRFESNMVYPTVANMSTINALVSTYVSNHSCGEFFEMWSDENDPRPIFRKANNPNITFVSCSQANPPWWQDVFNAVNLDSDPSQWIVTSPLYPGIELKQAIRTALNDITVDLDQPQHDSLALARFKQILTATYANMDEYGRELLATANAAMNYALTNAYALGILPVEYGVNPEPLDDAVYTLLASLDELISYNDDPMIKSKYALDKVLLYRLAGHYVTAIYELQNSEANEHINYSFWDCILQLEWSFFQGNISADQFALDAESCMSYFEARRQRRQPPVLPVYQNQSITTLLVAPNPTTNSSVFSFAACENPASFRILDAQGRVVYRNELAASATEHVVNAADLPAGIYFAELHQPNQKALRAKWVVHK
jgi:hypothetical protein